MYQIRMAVFNRPTFAMNMDPAKAFTFVLLGVHGFLALRALIGYVKWFSAAVPWPRLSNELFPRDILFMQWALTLAAAAIFIGGYALGWQHTPRAMACVSAAMAALCAVQTFGYLKGNLRFLAMGLEYLAYAVILAFLFRSSVFQPT